MMLATAIATLARVALDLVAAPRHLFITFYPAIMVSAWYGGFWPGLACTILSAMLVGIIWLPPMWELEISDIGDGIALIFFVALGIAIASIHESLHRERGQLQAARVEAERATAVARQAQHEAEVVNQAKDEFLGILSHELRTPLNAILGWVNLLRTRKLDAATQCRSLKTIERNALALAQLIEDIFDITRIVAGKLRLHLQPTDPVIVVNAALEGVRPAAEAKGVVLEAALGPDVGEIHADPDRLQQITWNLLSNAVKFTPPGGRVEVRIERRQSRLQLCVTDTGEGISADFLPHVFERFRQADATTTRAHGGLGIGLAIVKHLVDLHGGSITAESGGPGKGAKFTVSLSIRAIQSTMESEAGVFEVDQKNEGQESATSLSGVRVLVVDDDPDARKLVATILKDRGARVVVAASTAEALRALETRPVDVLVSDIGMPGKDGYALIYEASVMLAEQERYVPALALTAYAGPEDAERVQRAGFRMHIAKPAVAEQLIQAIAQLVTKEPESPEPPRRFL
jgi:signal transduction histidine kinase/ActR/RegA family two-component response regulator